MLYMEQAIPPQTDTEESMMPHTIHAEYYQCDDGHVAMIIDYVDGGGGEILEESEPFRSRGDAINWAQSRLAEQVVEKATQ